MQLFDRTVFTMVKSIVALILLAALAGCDEPKFDMSSPETWQNSRLAVEEDWGGDFWPRYNQAVVILVTARHGWRKPQGRSVQSVLDKIEGDSHYEGGMDEAMFRLAEDLARERSNKDGDVGNPTDQNIAYEFLRTELDGKSASDLFEMAEASLPKIRGRFDKFRKSLISAYAEELRQEEQTYQALAAEAAKVKVEIFDLRDVNAGIAQGTQIQNAQQIFSFRLTNDTAKPINRIVFARGVKQVGLRKLIFDFPTPVLPGTAIEKFDLAVDSGADPMAASGAPRFMNVQFMDGSWFPKKDMERSYEDYLVWRGSGVQSMRERLKGYQNNL